jgi:hypothetical protein
LNKGTKNERMEKIEVERKKERKKTAIRVGACTLYPYIIHL